MKVLIFANNDVGLYQFRKELIMELLKKREVAISLPYGDFIPELIEMGCKFIDTSINRRSKNPITDLRLLIKYINQLKQEKPDFVITYTIKPNVYGGIACRLLGIPYAVNVTGLGSSFEGGGLLKRIVTVMNHISCKKAKIVFFENEENCQIFLHEKIVKKSQTQVLNGAGVNLEKYQVVEYPKNRKIKFLFMGRVMAEKGINELFGAMRRLISDGVECELAVLGSYEENYKDSIDAYEKEGWLHYYGYQKDVKPFIAEAHCFVLPSWHEGMANSNLESAASGRPIITSDIPGCREAVIDGKSGFLVKRKNGSMLYEKMKMFTELSYEERRVMGLVGRKHMEEVFDKKKVVEDTIKCLKLD